MLTRILQRPDIGAFLGAVAVFVLFSITASDVQLGRRTQGSGARG